MELESTWIIIIWISNAPLEYWLCLLFLSVYECVSQTYAKKLVKLHSRTIIHQGPTSS